MKLYRASYKCKHVLTGSGSATSPRFCTGDGRMIGVASENIKKRIQIAYQGGVTRKVRFRNWYDIGSSPLHSCFQWILTLYGVLMMNPMGDGCGRHTLGHFEKSKMAAISLKMDITSFLFAQKVHFCIYPYVLGSTNR